MLGGGGRERETEIRDKVTNWVRGSDRDVKRKTKNKTPIKSLCSLSAHQNEILASQLLSVFFLPALGSVTIPPQDNCSALN